jgi:branched-chain amino acid transport system permease protein
MTVVLSGISTGALYVLVAVGLNVVFATAGVFNFAQAQFVMAGTFISYWTASQLHLPVALGFLLGAAIGLTVGIVEERVAIRPVLGKGVHAELVTTIGFAVVLDGAASLIWGTQPLVVPFFARSTFVNFLGGTILPVQLVMIGVAIVLPIGMELWSRFSLTGLASLAAAEDRSAAMIRGINVRRFTLWAVAGAAAFGGALGPIVGPQTYAVFNLGDALAITAFVALAIGGFGSYTGALIGGMLIGITQQVSVRYLSALYQNLIVFGLLVAVLMLRPEGLFRSHTRRVV